MSISSLLFSYSYTHALIHYHFPIFITCIPSSFLSAFYLTAPTDHDYYLQNISTFRRLGPNGPPNSAISFASSPFTLKWNLLLMRLQVRTMPDMAITWLRLRGLTGSKFRCNDKQLFRMVTHLKRHMSCTTLDP